MATIKVFSHNSLVSGIIAIIFGLLLVYFKGEFINLILMVAGYLMFAFAIIRFIAFLIHTSKTENRWAYLPFSIIFSAIIGILFIVAPAFWVSISEIIIAVFILFLAMGKITLLAQLKMNNVNVSYIYFIIPLTLLIVGILAIIDPAFVLGSITVAFGALLILFGISEIIDYIIIRNKNLSRKFGSISYNQSDEGFVDAEEVKDEN